MTKDDWAEFMEQLLLEILPKRHGLRTAGYRDPPPRGMEAEAWDNNGYVHARLYWQDGAITVEKVVNFEPRERVEIKFSPQDPEWVEKARSWMRDKFLACEKEKA